MSCFISYYKDKLNPKDRSCLSGISSMSIIMCHTASVYEHVGRKPPDKSKDVPPGPSPNHLLRQ